MALIHLSPRLLIKEMGGGLTLRLSILLETRFGSILDGGAAGFTTTARKNQPRSEEQEEGE